MICLQASGDINESRSGPCMRETHSLCNEHDDVVSASLLENWIDETEGRVWFPYEAGRN